MATLKVYTLEKRETDTCEIDDSIVNSELNPFVIKDTVVYLMAKQRQGTHKAKGRSEVAGSNRKLFRQKGTGRARAGSKKPPHWRSGGVAFGPVVREHTISLNKKVRKNALKSLIAEKIRNDKLMVVDQISLEDHKTKKLAEILKSLEFDKVLFVYSETNEKLLLASNNLSNVKAVHTSGVNVYDVLYYNQIIITKDALSEVEERLK